jgi:hypothetical protein
MFSLFFVSSSHFFFLLQFNCFVYVYVFEKRRKNKTTKEKMMDNIFVKVFLLLFFLSVYMWSSYLYKQKKKTTFSISTDPFNNQWYSSIYHDICFYLRIIACRSIRGGTLTLLYIVERSFFYEFCLEWGRCLEILL